MLPETQNVALPSDSELMRRDGQDEREACQNAVQVSEHGQDKNKGLPGSPERNDFDTEGFLQAFSKLTPERQEAFIRDVRRIVAGVEAAENKQEAGG